MKSKIALVFSLTVLVVAAVVLTHFHHKQLGEALHRAAYAGDVTLVRDLLSRGADPESREKFYGLTPLIVAAHQGNAEVVKVLLEQHANVNAYSSVEVMASALGEAAAEGHVDVMKLLLDCGANIEAAGPEGLTPLVLAAHWGRAESVRLLLSRGANVNVKDSRGRTPLDQAIMNLRLPSKASDAEYKETVRILKEAKQ